MRYAHVPPVFECFTRFSPDLDGSPETVCDQGPIWSAPVCGAGGSCGGYTCMDGSRPSRGAEKSSYQTL